MATTRKRRAAAPPEPPAQALQPADLAAFIGIDSGHEGLPSALADAQDAAATFLGGTGLDGQPLTHDLRQALLLIAARQVLAPDGNDADTPSVPLTARYYLRLHAAAHP